jgi:SAM-dependent methyltransferase
MNTGAITMSGQADPAFQAGLYESRNPTRRWLHRSRRDWVLHTIRTLPVEQPDFLEVGVGAGIYTVQLAALGAVTALDINPAFLARVAHLKNVRTVAGDIRFFDEAGVADIALCSEVIEHIVEGGETLCNLHRALRPGGYLVLTTPNRQSPLERLSRLIDYPLFAWAARRIYGEGVEPLGHINSMRRQDLARQIHAAGFEIIKTTDLGLYIPVLAEWGGGFGQKVAAWLEKRISQRWAHYVLWTQCWVLRRPA